jgi:hypothetical protein
MTSEKRNTHNSHLVNILFFSLTKYITIQMEYYIVAIIIFLVLLIIFNVVTSSRDKDDDCAIFKDPPKLFVPKKRCDEFAENTVNNFDSSDTTGIASAIGGFVGVGGGDVPQLSETDTESPEYKRQMKTLIDYMISIGHKKKVVNDYVHYIRDMNFSPQLILMQLKNDPHAPPVNIS